MKSYVLLIYGLFVIWTGLQASIDAQRFKANAFWFCSVMGVLTLLSSLGFRAGWRRTAFAVAIPTILLVLGFYVYCFFERPSDLTERVGRVIVASFGALTLLFFPREPAKNSE